MEGCQRTLYRQTLVLNNLDLYGSYGYQGNTVNTVSPELIATDVYEYLYNSYGLEIVSLLHPDLRLGKDQDLERGY